MGPLGYNRMGSESHLLQDKIADLRTRFVLFLPHSVSKSETFQLHSKLGGSCIELHSATSWIVVTLGSRKNGCPN
jgi:hypothetical protein